MGHFPSEFLLGSLKERPFKMNKPGCLSQSSAEEMSIPHKT
jgi:hypothetical protein